MMKIPTTLIIMDGYGIAPASPSNAVTSAKTPVLDGLTASNPYTTLSASGVDVGLPEGQIGNSEVGHTNIGAGRVVYQDLSRITNEVRSGAFFDNPAISGVMSDCAACGGALHLFGLLSDGGVHSHIEHLFALLEAAKKKGLERVYIHCFLDGRDVPPCSGKGYVEALEDKCRELQVGKIATIMGRFYAMDRDKRWERVERAYNAIVFGEGEHNADPAAAVQSSYDKGVTDEFMEPVVLCEDGRVQVDDAVIFYNFRPDRARELTRAFVDPDFDGFERSYFPVKYVCMKSYDDTMPNVSVAYPPEELRNTFGERVSALGLTQFRIAETEKYAHVTFFFNGGAETVFPGEERKLIQSPREYPTYDMIPEMSARSVTDGACEAILSGKYDIVIINLANCDMVGHTGNFDAAVEAVQTVDVCVGRILEANRQMGGVTIITADHGNAEEMLEPDGVTPHTAHSTNPVPFIIDGASVKLRPGRLADIAPTMLDLMGLEKPEEMTGETLIVDG